MNDKVSALISKSKSNGDVLRACEKAVRINRRVDIGRGGHFPLVSIITGDCVYIGQEDWDLRDNADPLFYITPEEGAEILFMLNGTKVVE